MNASSRTESPETHKMETWNVLRWGNRWLQKAEFWRNGLLWGREDDAWMKTQMSGRLPWEAGGQFLNIFAVKLLNFKKMTPCFLEINNMGRGDVCPYESLLSYLPTPPLGQDMTQGQFLSGV